MFRCYFCHAEVILSFLWVLLWSVGTPDWIHRLRPSWRKRWYSRGRPSKWTSHTVCAVEVSPIPGREQQKTFTSLSLNWIKTQHQDLYQWKKNTNNSVKAFLTIAMKLHKNLLPSIKQEQSKVLKWSILIHSGSNLYNLY